MKAGVQAFKASSFEWVRGFRGTRLCLRRPAIRRGEALRSRDFVTCLHATDMAGWSPSSSAKSSSRIALASISATSAVSAMSRFKSPSSSADAGVAPGSVSPGIVSPRSEDLIAVLDLDRFLGARRKFFEKTVELLDADVERDSGTRARSLPCGR